MNQQMTIQHKESEKKDNYSDLALPSRLRL